MKVTQIGHLTAFLISLILLKCAGSDDYIFFTELSYLLMEACLLGKPTIPCRRVETQRYRWQVCIRKIKVFESDCKNTRNPTDTKPVLVSYDLKITACAAQKGEIPLQAKEEPEIIKERRSSASKANRSHARLVRCKGCMTKGP